MKATASKKPEKRRTKKVPQGRPLHFLIVEGEPAPAEQIRRGLLSFPSPYRLTVAATLAGARACISSDNPDLVLLDLNLPDGSGEDILPEHPGDLRFPVIVLIDDGNEEAVFRLNGRGVMDCVAKNKAAFDDLPRTAAQAMRNWTMWQSQRMLEWRLNTQEFLVRAMMENPVDSISLINRKGTILDLNNTFAHRLGRPRSDLLGTCVYDYFPGDLMESRREYVDRVFRTGDVVRFDDERDGRFYDNIIQPVKNGDGGIRQAVIVARDITDQKTADLTLRKREEQYRYLVENMKEAVWMTTPDLKFTFNNRAAEEQTGYSPEELAGRPLTEILTPASAETVKEQFREWKAKLGRKKTLSAAVEVEFQRKDGSTGQAEVNVTPMLDPEGRLAGFQGIARDITGRKRSEAALRESEERYRTLVEELPDFVIVHRNGELLYINTAVSRILGTTAEILLRTSILDYIPQDMQGVVRSAMEKRAAGDVLLPYVAKVSVPGTDIRWVEIRGARIMFEGQPATLNVLTDITEKKWAEEALFASEQKFRTLADYTFDWEYWIGPDGEPVYVSPSCERITGYTSEEFYRDKTLFYGIVLPEEQEMLRAHYLGTVDSADLETLEFRIRKKDGTIAWIGHLCQPIYGPGGEHLGRRGSNRDITLRKLAEDALRVSETRFRALIQNASGMIRILDRHGMILYESPSSEKIHGYPSGALIGKNAGDYLHPDDRARVKADFRAVLDQNNSGVPTEFRICRADGTSVWVDSLAVNLIGVPGVDGIVVTTRLIEQRKKMEHAIRESEARYRGLFDMSPVGIVLTDTEGNILEMNQSMLEIFGLTRDDIGSVKMGALYVDKKARDTVVRTILDRGSVNDYELVLKRSDGSTFPAILNSSLVSKAGKPLFQTSVLDITDRKLMEEEIRSLNRALEQRVIQRTNELNASLGEKEVLLREIHHRVKNNLQIIISILRLQNRHTNDPGTQAILRDSESRVRSMALVHEKLYRSIDLAHIDIGDYLRDLARYLFNTYSVNPSQVVLRVEIAEISLDINRAIPVGLILNELISNALKHAYPDGRKGEMLITGREENETIVLSLRDDGIGMPAGFDWRHSPSLGMHLVMTLIDQARGTIERPDCATGTHFVIQLPREARTAVQ